VLVARVSRDLLEDVVLGLALKSRLAARDEFAAPELLHVSSLVVETPTRYLALT
jgi:hypothetical protein